MLVGSYIHIHLWCCDLTVLGGMVIDYRNWHLGLGRRFRSLKLWFVLRGFGAEGFRKYIRRVRLSPFYATYSG